MADAALSAAQWVVEKALAPIADGVLEKWAACRNFGLNIEDLRMELLLVKATLEQAARKEICGTAMEELLQRLRDSAHNAEDLLDELDYFRIHDELQDTYDAADHHGNGAVPDLARDARHTVKALGKLVNCFPWQRAELQQRSYGDSFLASDVNQEVSGCMPNLGKLLLSSCSQHPHVRGHEDSGNAQETPMPEFNRVEFSQRMKSIVEKLQPVRKDVNKILHGCGPRIVLDIAQHRPTTTPQSAEPKLYGRDCVMNSIIHDITEGQYRDKGLTVLPVIGPGGTGKTTLIQHIYNNQQVQNHFPVRIWICVSFSFHLGKVLEEIKKYTPKVEGEKECIRLEELIEQRLEYKRFLLVLDDIWQFTDVDDWKKLLLILGKSQEKGSIILVTTRQKEIADQVKETEEPKELDGLEPGEFRKLFLVYVFDAEQYPRDKLHLFDTGDKIMGKLKGSPLAAKTVGRLLRTDPSLAHWRRVLNSKQWVEQTNGIMPALELSYDFLPFHLQRCFSYSALFPEDCRLRSCDLISLWIGLDILTPCGQNPTFEGIGLNILNDLVIHGFFREEETDDGLRYVMHDLLHELALKVSSHDCLNFRISDVGSVEIKPTTRHLSISIENLGKYNAASAQKLMRELEKLKTRLKVEKLQTLMLFGGMYEGFAKIFGDFFGEANAFRVLYLPDMTYPMESMLHNFSRLVHLRCLCLGSEGCEVYLPLGISKFYHLRVLDLQLWPGCTGDFPEDMSNLAKLCHYYAPGDDSYDDDDLHFDICNGGKLKLLEKLKVFPVNTKSEGFEPKQLEHLTKLWELGIYNLEKIHTEDEAAQAKLIEKKCLRRLTLDWDSEQSSVEPGMEGVVLQSLQPHVDLQVLCIRGYGGPSCPTWLGDELDLRELRLKDMARLKEFIIGKSFCMLIKLELIGLASFEKWVYPAELEASLGGEQLPKDAHMFPLLQVLIIRKCPKLLGLPFSNHIVSSDWFPKLQVLEVYDCPEFLPVIPMSWIGSLRFVMIKCVKMLKEFVYSKSSNGAELEIIGEGDMHTLDQVLVFDKETGLEQLTLERCPPLELKHLLMLTSMKTLIVKDSDGGDLLPLDAHMFPLLQVLIIRKCPKLLGLSFSNHIISLDWFPKLQVFEVCDCPEFLPVIPISWIESLCSITMTCVKMLKELTYSKSSDRAKLVIIGEGDLHTLDQVLVFDKEICLEQLTLERCPPLELKHLLMLTSMKTLIVKDSDGGDLLPLDAHMFPLLQVLIIRKCPKLLGLPFSTHVVSPDWFPKLQELEIQDCPEFSSVIPISWIESLHHVKIRHVKMLKELTYSKSSDGAELNITGKGDLHSLDQVFIFDKETCIEKLTLDSCPPLDLKHLLMVTSLKTLFVEHSDCLVGPGQGDVEWQLPVEHMRIWDLNGSGEELTELLLHLPKLSKLEINGCRNIKKLVVGVDVQQTTSEAPEMGGCEITAAEEEDDGVLLFPPHLCDSLLELEIDDCPELVLVNPTTLVPSRGCLQALRSLQRLTIKNTPKFISAFLFFRHLFPSSLQFLTLWEVEGMGTLEPLSNLSSVTVLALCWCGENLKCQGLQSLLTTGGQLNELKVSGSPGFFAGWDPNPKRALVDVEGGGEQQAHLVLSTLLELCTDGTTGLLSAPVCSFLSSSLTKLELRGRFSKGMERFTKEQEDALQLLSSLQELKFWYFRDLQQLPAGLHNLTSLKKLTIDDCPAISSLPNDSLPKSLQVLDVTYCFSQKLEQQCRGLVGIIPTIRL